VEDFHLQNYTKIIHIGFGKTGLSSWKTEI